MRPHTTLFRSAITTLSLLLLCGCSTLEKKTPGPAYAVSIVKGAATELDHRVFDASLPGYWLVGAAGTIQVSRVNDEPLPKTFSFMLRTRPDATPEAPSRIATLRITSPLYRVVTKFNPGAPAPVDIMAYSEKKTVTEFVLVKTDSTGKYIAFEQAGAHVKVTLTTELMAVLGDDFVLTWEDAPDGTKSDSAKAVSAEAAERRIL